jgi:hypothetical protein
MQGSNTTMVQIATAASANPTISVQFTLMSVPNIATYSGGTSGTQCSITLQAVDGNWTADPLNSLGACSLVIENIHPLSADATQRHYDLVGTFSATLQADDGVSPAITLRGAFE